MAKRSHDLPVNMEVMIDLCKAIRFDVGDDLEEIQVDEMLRSFQQESGDSDMNDWENEKIAAKKDSNTTGGIVDLFKYKAEEGNAEAQWMLGKCYYSGDGVEQNKKMALYWLEEAAGQGNVDAQLFLASLYMTGEKDIEQDETKGICWLKEAASQGNVKAQQIIAECYDEGKGVAKDMKEAAIWYRKVAEQGDEYAQLQLGFRYSMGLGVQPDMQTAMDWFAKAAAQGNSKAKKMLDEYSKKKAQEEREQDERIRKQEEEKVREERARKEKERKKAEYEKALAAIDLNPTNPKDQHKLGLRYMAGDVVGRDLELAAEWLQKAAESGYAPAQMDLGMCYRYGQGVIKNENKALEWYNRAALNGDRMARRFMGEILEEIEDRNLSAGGTKTSKAHSGSHKPNHVITFVFLALAVIAWLVWKNGSQPTIFGCSVPLAAALIFAVAAVISIIRNKGKIHRTSSRQSRLIREYQREHTNDA